MPSSAKCCTGFLAGAMVLLLLAACSEEPEGGADSGQLQDGPVSQDRGRDFPDLTSVTFTLKSQMVISASQSAHLAFPSVTRLAPGGLLLAYRRGASHVDSSGRIMKQTGSSDGSTWSAPELLFDQAGVDDRDPSLATLASGHVVVTAFAYRTVSTASGTVSLHHIFFGRSLDHGKTFSALVQVDPGSMTVTSPTLDASGQWIDGQGKPIVVMACSSPLVEVGSRLLLPAYGGRSLNLSNLAGAARSRISIFASSDQGQTFKEERVMHDEAKDLWLQEPALLALDDKSWLLHVRTSKQTSPSGAGYLARAGSTDGGQTWTAWSDFSFIGHAPDLLRLKNGVLVSAFRGLNDTYTKASVSFVYSLDQGRTFSALLQVEDCGSSECGYPSMVELSGNRLLVVYYTSQGGAAIRAALYSFKGS